MKKEEDIIFYEIDSKYISYLRKYENKVSLKNSRTFLGLELTIDKKKYCVPFTSTIIPNSGKKRHGFVTTNIKDYKDETIACILYNNMIPTLEKHRNKIDFKKHKHSSYLNMEYQYIKNNFEKIRKKAEKVYVTRIDGKNNFLNFVCCDFKILEKFALNYENELNKKKIDPWDKNKNIEQTKELNQDPWSKTKKNDRGIER